MKDENVAITKEEAELIFRKPTVNIIKVTKELTSKLLGYMVKNHLLHFEKVEVHASGSCIGKVVIIAKTLEEEKAVVIDKLETDLSGEEPKFKPTILVILARPKN